jgi:hypothetical protein
VFIARAMCGIGCNSSRFVLQLQSATVSRAVTSSLVNERDPGSRELNPVQFICNSVIYYLCLINSSTLDVWITASAAACPAPSLNFSSSSVRPGTTSKIRSPSGQQDTTICRGFRIKALRRMLLLRDVSVHIYLRITRHAKYVKRKTEERSCNHFYGGKANDYYTSCVCICSLRYTTCNAHAPYYDLWPAPLYKHFPLYLINGTIFGGWGELLNIKRVFRVSLQFLSEIFFILRRMERDMIETFVTGLHVKYSNVILVRFEWNLNFLDRFKKNTEISNSMKILLVTTELFHTDRRTDGHDEVNSRFSQFCESA